MSKIKRTLYEIITELKNDMSIMLKIAKDKNINLEEVEENMSEEARELRWKSNITEAIVKISNVIKKNDDAKQLFEIEYETLKTKVQTNKDAINVLTHEDQINKERMIVIEDKVMQLNDDMLEQASDLINLDGKFNEEIEGKIDTLTSKLDSMNLNKSAESINPNISNKVMIKIKPPIFSGEKYDKPLKFLSDLKKYVCTYCHETENVNALINQCLQKSAKDWFYFVEDKINNFDEFEKEFKDRYWSDEIKSGLKRKLDIGIFMHNGNLSRAQYATQMLNIAKDVYPEKTEKEIIIQLANQFERAIKLTVKTQKIGTKTEFFYLLEDFDRDDYSLRKKRNYNNNNNQSIEKNNDKKSENDNKKQFPSKIYHNNNSPKNKIDKKNDKTNKKENNYQKRSNNNPNFERNKQKDQHIDAIVVVNEQNNDNQENN